MLQCTRNYFTFCLFSKFLTRLLSALSFYSKNYFILINVFATVFLLKSLFRQSEHYRTQSCLYLDDTKPTIIYDEVKKQWIDTSADPSTQDNSMLNGPPKMSVPSNGAPQFQFNKSARKARYVDVFNQK